MIPFRWNADAMRYIDASGRFVARSQIRAALDIALRNESRSMKALAILLRGNRITISAWQDGMRASLKNIQIYSAAAARGGFAQLTARDYGTIGARLRAQYTYLDRFAGEIEAGLPLNGAFLRRAAMYAQSGRALYHAIDGRVHAAKGFNQERSLLGVADHCDDCVEEAARGWVLIGELIPIGSRQCLSYCHCRIEYRAGA